METPDQEQKKSKSTLWIILLLISLILNFYQWRNHTTSITTFEQKVDTLVVERVNVEKELADTKTELNKYQGISTNMDKLLAEANAKIDVFEKNMKSMTAKQKNSAELNKELRE